ncbi:ABC transporter permease [Cryobacterium sp. Y50]|uniref:ABC transporter permease n=2 Tax=unclassified Cryobacterium TaxID=2649013 RepID=UPI000CE4B34C|nr:ABC transporter permease [Cryobacterium sp. Y50]
MARFMLQRVITSIVTLFLASIVVFVGVRLLPGDPALVLAGETADPAVVAAIREQFGLNQPIWIQYFNYVGQALQGNFGVSTRDRIPVAEILLQRLPITLELAGLAILVGVLIGLTAGIVSAVKRGSFADYAANAFGLIGLSVPHFWLGMLAILFFAINLQVLPASGYVAFTEDPGENLRRMILPALVLGTGLSAVLMRQTRAALLGQLSADYVRTARSKGVSRSREVKHALRNSLTTVVTVLGLQLGALIGGAIITEQIFVIPGFGKLIIDAVSARNYPVLQGAVLVAVTGYVLVNLAVDIAYAYLNPRMRLAGGAR